MSDDAKKTERDRLIDSSLMYPLGMNFGERIGREMGLLAARVGQVEIAVAKLDDKIEKLDAKLDAVEARLDARIDKCLMAIIRLDERTVGLEGKFRLSIGLSVAILAAVIAGTLLQLMN